MDSSSVPIVFLPKVKKAGQPSKKPLDSGAIKSSFVANR
jgi:hypothetical protein